MHVSDFNFVFFKYSCEFLTMTNKRQTFSTGIILFSYKNAAQKITLLYDECVSISCTLRTDEALYLP